LIVTKVIVGFFVGLLGFSWHWRIWVALLILVNAIVPLFFLETPEARLVLIAMMLGALIQMGIFRYRGFVRLLGVGHLLVWPPLLLWLWLRPGGIDTSSYFGKWLLVVIALDLGSLLIDAVDVVRYALGDRQPTLTLEDLE
jgi:hypothetical protein